MKELYELIRLILMEIDQVNRGKNIKTEKILKKFRQLDKHLSKTLSKSNLSLEKKIKHLEKIKDLVDNIQFALPDGLSKKNLSLNAQKLNKKPAPIIAFNSLHTTDKVKSVPLKSILEDYSHNLHKKYVILSSFHETETFFLRVTNQKATSFKHLGKNYIPAVKEYITCLGYAPTELQEGAVEKKIFTFFGPGGKSDKIVGEVCSNLYFNDETCQKYMKAFEQYLANYEKAMAELSKLQHADKSKAVNFSQYTKITSADICPLKNESLAAALDKFKADMKNVAHQVCPKEASMKLALKTSTQSKHVKAAKKATREVASILKDSESLFQKISNGLPCKTNDFVHFTGSFKMAVNNKQAFYIFREADQVKLKAMPSITKKHNLKKAFHNTYQIFNKKRSLNKLLKNIFPKALMGPIDKLHLVTFGFVSAVVFTSRFMGRQLGYEEPESKYNLAHYFFKRDNLREKKANKINWVAIGKHTHGVVSQKTLALEKTISLKDAAIELAQLDIKTIQFAQLYGVKETKYGTFTSDTSRLAMNDIDACSIRIHFLKDQIKFRESTKLFNYKAETLMELMEEPTKTIKQMQDEIKKREKIMEEAYFHLSQHQKLLARVCLKERAKEFLPLSKKTEKNIIKKPS